MFVISNFLLAVATVLKVFIYFEIVAILVSALLSWITPYKYHPLRQFVDAVSNIVLSPLRRFIPPMGPVDITPMIGILILVFLNIFLVQTLLDVAVRIR
ncbi:MAG: YggT family protein [Thermotogae bacterium]|nr:MAG: YggT family protein [Thermotogota bacterium]RKX42485.1 MAG: YggT family protein [Thermotogota bacterium]